MITRKEADKRVKAWRGSSSQQIFEHSNGHKFMRTNLLFMQAPTKILHPGSNRKEEWENVVMESFVHAIK